MDEMFSFHNLTWRTLFHCYRTSIYLFCTASHYISSVNAMFLSYVAETGTVCDLRNWIHFNDSVCIRKVKKCIMVFLLVYKLTVGNQINSIGFWTIIQLTLSHQWWCFFSLKASAQLKIKNSCSWMDVKWYKHCGVWNLSELWVIYKVCSEDCTNLKPREICWC